MFWDSVWKGFLILLQWKIWIFVAAYSLIAYLHHSYFLKKFLDSETSAVGMARVVNSYSVLKALIDTFIIVLTTFFIFPILAGVNQLMPLRDIKGTLGLILIITAVIVVIRIVLNAVSQSGIKEAFNKGASGTSLFICILLIYFMSHEIFGGLPDNIELPKNSYPGFFACLGFALLTFPVILIFTLLLGLVLLPFSKESRELVTATLTLATTFLMGIIYMRMYCAYIMHNIQFEYNPSMPI